MGKKQKEKKKGFGRFLKNLILIGFISVLLILSALFINYIFSRQIPENYLSDSFILYTKVESIGTLYENIIDLKALEVLLSTQQQRELFLALNSFKTSSLAQQRSLKWLLNIEAHFQIQENGEITGVLDPGIRSIMTRLVPSVLSFVTVPDVEYNVLQRSGYAIYEYPLNEEMSIYFHFHKNLILFSTTPEGILGSFENRDTNHRLSDRTDLDPMMSRVREKGMLTCFIDPALLLDYIMEEDDPAGEFIKREFDFTSTAILTLELSNEKLSVSMAGDMKPSRSEVGDFLMSGSQGELEILDYIPDTATVFTAYHFSSFWDMYQIFLLLQEGQYDEILTKAERASEGLFDLTLDEMFSWIGSEGGVYYMENATEPVLFLQIGDQTQLDLFLKKLTDSLFFKQGQDILIENVRIQQIVFPDFLQLLINQFAENIEEPYFLIIDDAMFISLDAENLAKTKIGYITGETFKRNRFFKDISRGFPEDANLFLFYDLSENLPVFLIQNPQWIPIARLYGKGLLTLSLTENEYQLELAAVPDEQYGVQLFPGYPRELPGKPSGYLLPVYSEKESLPFLVYSDRQGHVRTADLSGTALESRYTGEDTVLIKSGDARETTVWTYSAETGRLMNLSAELKDPEDGLSIQLGKSTFAPFSYWDRIYSYNPSTRKIVSIDMTSGNLTELPLELLKPVQTEPAISGDAMAVYPRDLTGTLYLAHLDGSIMDGWPVQTGGVSSGSPVIFTYQDTLFVAFLNQNGQLNLLSGEGRQINGFPMQLNRVFYTSPVIIQIDNIPHIAVLDENGQASIVTLDGRILIDKTLNPFYGKELTMSVENIDGEESIVIWGGGNNLLITNNLFSPKAGFPVTGSVKPLFIDINGNGKKELITLSIEGELLIYSMNRSE